VIRRRSGSDISGTHRAEVQPLRPDHLRTDNLFRRLHAELEISQRAHLNPTAEDTDIRQSLVQTQPDSLNRNISLRVADFEE
jgi:hypothetical protein